MQLPEDGAGEVAEAVFEVGVAVFEVGTGDDDTELVLLDVGGGGGGVVVDAGGGGGGAALPVSAFLTETSYRLFAGTYRSMNVR